MFLRIFLVVAFVFTLGTRVCAEELSSLGQVPETPESVLKISQAKRVWSAVVRRYLAPAARIESDSEKILSADKLEAYYWLAVKELETLPDSDAKYDSLTSVAFKLETVVNPHISKLNNLWGECANEKALRKYLSCKGIDSYELDFEVARRLEFGGQLSAAERLYKKIACASCSGDGERSTGTKSGKVDQLTNGLIQANYEVYRDFLYRQERDQELKALDASMRDVCLGFNRLTDHFRNGNDPNVLNIPLYKRYRSLNLARLNRGGASAGGIGLLSMF